MKPVVLWLAGALALATGCDYLTPEVGAPLVARCTDDDSDPDTQVSFRQDILPLFEEYCVGCHTPGGRSPIGIEVGRLNLESYTSLRAGGAISGSNVIQPGQPCASVLHQKLGPAPPFGGRMPLNGPPFVDEDEILLVHDWIAEGAREN